MRWFSGIGAPSNLHTIWGSGFPDATHFKETDGPGWIVCSSNVSCNSGTSSANNSEIISWKWNKCIWKYHIQIKKKSDKNICDTYNI